MKSSGKNIHKKKLKNVMKRMNRSLKGVRRIANEFSKRTGKKISKSYAHKILRKEDLIRRKKRRKRPRRKMKRPEKPFKEFAIDFGEKTIVGGGRMNFLPIMDLFSNAFILLDAHNQQSGKAVISSLSKLRQLFRGWLKITLDNGKEFKNNDVMEYCKRNEIELNFIEKGCPWMNPFIERAIRTIKEEYLNLMWIDENQDEQVILNEIRGSYNQRGNMSLGYLSPLQFLGNYHPNSSGV